MAVAYGRDANISRDISNLQRRQIPELEKEADIDLFSESNVSGGEYQRTFCDCKKVPALSFAKAFW
jgi:hypothetical protein